MLSYVTKVVYKHVNSEKLKSYGKNMIQLASDAIILIRAGAIVYDLHSKGCGVVIDELVGNKC